MNEEKNRDIETMQMKHNLEMEHVRSKLGKRTKRIGDSEKCEMGDSEKSKRGARRLKEEKEKVREQAGVAEKVGGVNGNDEDEIRNESRNRNASRGKRKTKKSLWKH